MTRRGIIYCRVSTKEQVQNLSLSTQEKVCEDYCKGEGIEVDKVFVEEGESAKTTDRPALQELLSYCRENKGKIQYVVVHSVSRFSRLALDYAVTTNLLKKLGVQLRSATEPINDTAVGKFTEGMLSVWAQFDNDMKSERTVTGMKAAIQEGRWTFKAPLGYLNSGDPIKGKKIILDPVRAPLLQKAFELYANGNLSKKGVLEKITLLGLHDARGRELSPQTFDKILRNPIYAGWLVVSKWQIRERGNFDPLITQELFEKTQDVLKGKRPQMIPHMRNHPDFPLRLFVRCGRCGSPLTGSWSRGRKQRYAYYHCRNKDCKGIYSRKEKIEEAFRSLLETLKPKSEFMCLFRAVVLDSWKQKQEGSEDLLKALGAKMQKLKERKDLLVNALLYSKIDQETYEEQLDKLNEEMALTEMDQHHTRLEQLDVEGVLAFAEHLLNDAARLWSDAGLDDKQRLQKAFFPSGLEFSPDGFGTAITSSIFNQMHSLVAQKEGLASRRGFEPLLPP